MFIQSLLFYLFFTYIIDEQKISIPLFIFLGLLTFMLYMTRTIGIAGIISASLFFIVTKSWKKLIAGIVSFSFFYLLTDVLKKTFWEMDGSQFSSQLKILLQKHPYQPAQGNENIAGFIQRFWDNSNLYLSEHLFRFIGFKNFTSTEISPVLTILVYILLAIALFYSFRKKQEHSFFNLVWYRFSRDHFSDDSKILESGQADYSGISGYFNLGFFWNFSVVYPSKSPEISVYPDIVVYRNSFYLAENNNAENRSE